MANSGEGVVLISIEGRTLGIDSCGNLVLNSSGILDGTPSRGVPGIVGKGIAYGVAITNGVGASANIANVSFQIVDVTGAAIAASFVLDVWLSDASTGIGLTATTPSGGIAAVTADGAVLDVGTTSKSVRVQTNAAGLMVLAITDTAKTAFWPVAFSGLGFAPTVGAQLTAGSYHA